MELIIKGTRIKFDKQDYDLVMLNCWYINKKGYAFGSVKSDNIRKTSGMHRHMLEFPEGLQVDHINHDRTDNRRSNLRSVTASENQRNRKNLGKCYVRVKNKYVVNVYGKYIDTVDSEEEAINTVKLIKSGGEYTRHEKIRLYCKRGHEMTERYNSNGKTTCKQCHTIATQKYFKDNFMLIKERKREKSRKLRDE